MLWRIGLRKSVAMLLLIGFSTFTLISCATERYQRNKGATIGGGAGAVTGGAPVGTVIGHYTSDQKRTEAEAQQRYAYNYNQSKAPLVRIEDAFASSSTVRRGDAFDLYTTYTVLGSKGATMDVAETREIRYQTGELTGKPQVTVQRKGGTYESRMPLILAADAQKGTYTVYATIQSGSSRDSKEFTFTVH